MLVQKYCILHPENADQDVPAGKVEVEVEVGIFGLVVQDKQKSLVRRVRDGTNKKETF